MYLSIPVGVYGTVWVIVIAHVTRYISYGSRAVISAQVQVHKELEEASYTCGASLGATLRKVVVPIVLPALVSLWLWVALHSLRELSSAVLLATPGNRVVSTMIWFAWQEGQVGEAYALSIMLIAVSLVIAFAARRLLTWGDPVAYALDGVLRLRFAKRKGAMRILGQAPGTDRNLSETAVNEKQGRVPGPAPCFVQLRWRENFRRPS